MKLSGSRLFVVLVLVAIATACAAPAATPVPAAAPAAAPTAVPTATPRPAGFSVTDALGRTVTFDKAPQRIAVVGRAVIMLADAVYLFPNVSPRIVSLSKANQGLGDFISVFDPSFRDKTILEVEVSVEQVVATRPDAVILKTMMADKLGKPLDGLGLKVIYLDLETPDQFKRDVATLGQFFQDEARARQVIAFYQERTDRISKAVADMKEEQKPRVLLLYYNDRDGQVAFNVAPMSYIQTLMVQTAGGRVAWKEAQLGQGWTKINLEQIAAWDADQIYIVAYTKSAGDVVKQLKADAQWLALRATKQNKLYAFPADYYSWDQADTRWILGLTWLATKMNPDRFPGFDMEKEIRTFYSELYKLDDASYQKNIQPVLKGDLN
jgi:iron complex transport system substrate-binding protein